MASILDAHEIALESQKPLILLTFPWWHLNWRYNTTKRTSKDVLFLLMASEKFEAGNSP